jgi:hypothetical protein
MTDLNYYGQVPRLPHHGGLIAWGVVLIVCGSFFGLSILFSIAMFVALSVKRGLDGPAIVVLAVQMVTASAMSGGLIWVGIATCQGRRWVRPLLVAGGWLIFSFGIASLLPMSVVLAHVIRDAAPSPGTTPVPKGLLVGSILIGAAVSAALMIGLPVAAALWFRRPGVGETLATLDPVPRWTDGVPLVRLAWVLACVLTGAGTVITGCGGIWFCFTVLLRGWPAAAVGLVVGAAMAGAGYGCLRRSSTAWSTAVTLFALQAVSAMTFAVAGDREAYQRSIAERTAIFSTAFTPRGASAPATNGADLVTQVNPTLTPAIMYAASVAFGLWARRRVVEDTTAA